jgi:hypothetical protein
MVRVEKQKARLGLESGLAVVNQGFFSRVARSSRRSIVAKPTRANGRASSSSF